MKDLTEMKNLLEAEKGYYSDKVWQIEARGEDVIKMIKERLDEAFIESLVR